MSCPSMSNQSDSAVLNAQNSVQQPPANSQVVDPSSVAPSPAPPTPPPLPKPESWTGNVTASNTSIRGQISVQVTVKYNNRQYINEPLKTSFEVPVGGTLHVSQELDLEADLTGKASNGLLSQTVTPTRPARPTPEPRTGAQALFADANMMFATRNGLRSTGQRRSAGGTPERRRCYSLDSISSDVFAKHCSLSLSTRRPTIRLKASNPTSHLFSVASVHSYTCSAAQSVQLLHSTSGIIDIQIDFLKSKVEAYIEDAKKGEWDSEIDCKSSEISDVVPIAVGAALAGLVVIVLIAYFIGRRRSRRLAYQSV